MAVDSPTPAKKATNRTITAQPNRTANLVGRELLLRSSRSFVGIIRESPNGCATLPRRLALRVSCPKCSTYCPWIVYAFNVPCLIARFYFLLSFRRRPGFQNSTTESTQIPRYRLDATEPLIGAPPLDKNNAIEQIRFQRGSFSVRKVKRRTTLLCEGYVFTPLAKIINFADRTVL